MIDTETARTKNVRAVLVQMVDFFILFYYTLFERSVRQIGIWW